MKNSIFLTILGLLLLLISCNKSPNASKEIRKAGHLISMDFTAQEIDSLKQGLDNYTKDFERLHEQKLKNSTPPAMMFNPIPIGFEISKNSSRLKVEVIEATIPENINELAFYSIPQLAYLIKNKKISSTELTKLYLKRIEKYNDTLKCVITVTKELALQQAAKADEEIANGIYRGILHGIPYGVKDLISTKNYKTTWGAESYKDQLFSQDAKVAQLLEEAGAVLIAKLSLGALAMGDVWYGGVTKNPWNLKQGSSGSSAGPASATAAGLVAFAIGSETWGSIVSPSTRCGVSGLRPSYGRVSRTGAMALSWSMDKLGPMCRSAEDCAIVFNAINGKDQNDQTLIEAPFSYNKKSKIRKYKIAYCKNLFEKETNKNDMAFIDFFKQEKIQLHPIDLNIELPIEELSLILMSEAAAAFDEFTRTNADDKLVQQHKYAWPNLFREARFIPAVEYINANRIRHELIQKLYEISKEYDAIICPSFGGNQLLMTNLTGNPCVVIPNGFTKENSPTSISIIGNLFEEGKLLEIASYYQSHTSHNNKIPDYFLN